MDTYSSVSYLPPKFRINSVLLLYIWKQVAHTWETSCKCNLTLSVAAFTSSFENRPPVFCCQRRFLHTQELYGIFFVLFDNRPFYMWFHCLEMKTESYQRPLAISSSNLLHRNHWRRKRFVNFQIVRQIEAAMFTFFGRNSHLWACMCSETLIPSTNSAIHQKNETQASALCNRMWKKHICIIVCKRIDGGICVHNSKSPISHEYFSAKITIDRNEITFISAFCLCKQFIKSV